MRPAGSRGVARVAAPPLVTSDGGVRRIDNQGAHCSPHTQGRREERTPTPTPTHMRKRAPSEGEKARAHDPKKKLVRLKKPRLPSALGLSGACGVEA
eukprot:scaffold496_cov119-Isochrysis_galbana.AAC.7